MKYDEIYQPKDWSRGKVNVLLSLDASKLDYSNNPRIHRADHDFPVAWVKMYGKGRVFYSTWVIRRNRGKIRTFARCILKRSSGHWA